MYIKNNGNDYEYYIDGKKVDSKVLGEIYKDNKLSKKAKYIVKMAMGGKLNGKLKALNGGELVDVAENVQQAVGNSHEEGGIEVGNTSVPKAEIENKELVVTTKDGQELVISDKIPAPDGKQSVADWARGIMGTGGYRKFEKLLKQYTELGTSNDKFQRGSGERGMQTLVDPLEEVFKYQEDYKQKVGMANREMQVMGCGGKLRKMADGGTFKKSDWVDEFGNPISEADIPTEYTMDNKYKDAYNSMALTPEEIAFNQEQSFKEGTPTTQTTTTDNKTTPTSKLSSSLGVDDIYRATAPFINYYAQMKGIKKASELPIPKREKAPSLSLETDVNINPQLQNITNTMAGYRKSIGQNVSSANTKSALMQGLSANEIAEKNKLYSDEQAREQTLRNNLALKNYEMSLGNKEIDFQNKSAEYQNKMQTISEQSGAFANLMESIGQNIRETNKIELDNKTIDVIKKQYEGSGVWNRNLSDWENATNISKLFGIKVK